MKKITLKEFKSLISWLSADEMVDMMPKNIEIDSLNYKLYYEQWFNIAYKKEYGYFHDIFIKHKSIDPKYACTKMLLRLLTNNYLSDYQLTDG